MSFNSRLQNVINLLQSTKIKERQEGISAFRTLFAQSSAIDRFYDSATREGRKSAHDIWATVLDGLQTCIRSEKSAYVSAKKSTNMIEKRLAVAAGTYRWFIEKAMMKFTKKTVVDVCDFLHREMKSRGTLIPSVALDFIKAYECVVSYPPHLARLEEESIWEDIVELAFNVVLKRPLRTPLAQDDTLEEAPSPAHTDNSEMFVEDSLTYDVDDDAAPGHKRKHVASQPVPSASKHRNQTVSTEQVASMSLLSVLLKSSSAPLWQGTNARSVLRCLERFFQLYTADSSLHHDFLSVTLSTINHVSLNHKDEVIHFSTNCWTKLLDLWGTKNKGLKEVLVAILRILFPFLTADPDIGESQTKAWNDNLTKLWNLMNGQGEKRWNFEPLSLCAIRLDTSTKDNASKAFRAKTFRSGTQFDPSQALTWTMLELQADCAHQLFQFFESTPVPVSQPQTSQPYRRSRLENPLLYLLQTVQTSQTPLARIYSLQILLFFIDRHWVTVHESLQSDIIRAFLDHVSSDDGTVQSWAFICLAAVAYADYNANDSAISSGNPHPNNSASGLTGPIHNVVPRESSTWDTVWTHAIRRASSPQVCRAACHAASVLLAYANTNSAQRSLVRSPLTSQRVLSEIESLAKDLDVQGPTSPYDSVCAFLSSCLKVANQDVRLYRMQFEEKVLTWLIDSWKPAHIGAPEAPMYLVSDVMTLLETICSSSQRSLLVCRTMLPQCLIAETVIEEQQSSVIRAYLLDAKLPSVELNTSQRQFSASNKGPLDYGDIDSTSVVLSETDLVQPRGRERKLSAFFLKALEATISTLQDLSGLATSPKANVFAKALDLAVLSLSFESVLVLNGIQCNKRVMQAACKVIASIVKLVDRPQWTMEEKGLILLALEPLVCIVEETYDDTPWIALLPPSRGTGIRSETLKSLLSDDERPRKTLQAERIKHLEALWRNADVQSTFNDVSDTLKDILRIIMGQPLKLSDDAMVVDDSFSVTETGSVKTLALGTFDKPIIETSALRHVAGICILFLSLGPLLQQASGEATRDRELTELMLEGARVDIRRFLLACPVYFDSIRKQTLSLGPSHLAQFISIFGDHLRSYSNIKSEGFNLQVISFLDATLSLWLNLAPTHENTADDFWALVNHYTGQLQRDKLKHWRIRDSVARLCDKYIVLDPTQHAWLDEEADSPMHILPSLIGDVDIRIRFRAAAINARMFEIPGDPMALYDTIRQNYTTQLEQFEHMLTRILSLGNIMVVSSAVRRGPYWHLLEPCFYTSRFNRHIETILTGVSQRMGLHKLSDLFEAYAYQLAFSILKSEHNILQFPVNLLGYKDRKERAHKTIRAFTLANLVTVGDLTARKRGRNLFQGHCQAVQRSAEDVIRECFGDIVAYQVLTLLDGEALSKEQIEVELLETLGTKDLSAFRETLKESVDVVAASLMRTLNEQDFTENGTIIRALQTFDGSNDSIHIFSLLTQYRRLDDIQTHITNLPNFGPHTILSALAWLMNEVPDADNHALTYHVLQALFADVQQSFLMNEQIRLVNSITFWVAYRHQKTNFRDATLLHTLTRGACSLLGQWDLVPAAQSILEWCFSLYDSGNDPRFPGILIRIACQCHDYATVAEDKFKTKCEALLDWMDQQTYTLSTIPGVVEQVKLALPAWPHEPSTILYPLFDAMDPTSLSRVLSDKHISSNKFRLVRRLRDQSQVHAYDDSQFAQTDFWRLKECMPPVHQLREEDIHAFASLLVLKQGSINGFSSEPERKIPQISQSKLRHQKDATRSRAHTTESSLILVLLRLLDDHDDQGTRHAAYRTLRSLMLTLSSESFDALYPCWPLEHRVEVSYLRQFRQLGIEREIPELPTSLSSSKYLELAQDFSAWISSFTILLADNLSASNRFYAQLCSMLESHTSFASTALPLLVQTLLRSSDAASHSSALSRYFSLLLSSETTAIACRRCIIDVVLHLRHIEPGSEDPLAYNRWLDISFLSLAQNAISCGAYTTALLFLELNADYKSPPAEDNISTEQIMYEIYRNIDEPDGFYAIQTQDHHQFLMRRFHHEKEWEKAFRFHGAALETDAQNSKEIEGLLQSFHSYGFNRIATQTLLNCDRENPNIAYQLGWRAETWDLPETHDGHLPGASLYLALRAIHRERDHGVTDAVIRQVLRKEMENLRNLGSENIAQIRDAIQSLMSLSQVVQWRSPFVQNLLASKSGDVSKWSTFTTVESGFRFDDVESIMATRLSLIKSARRKEQRDQIGNMLSPFSHLLLDVENQCLLHLSQAARETRQHQIALNSVIQARSLEGISPHRVKEEFASVLWSHKEEKHAVEYLKDLQREIGSDDPLWQAEVTARLGSWMAEACLEQPSFITHELFEKAIALVDGSPHNREGRASVYHQFAKFAEDQYKAALNSPDLIRLNVYKERKEKELRHYEQMKQEQRGRSIDKGLANTIAAVRKVLAQDNKAIADFIHNRDAYLEQAINMYSRCLEASDEYDEDVPIRFCSLWLSNFDYDPIQQCLVGALQRVPSRKLVFLAHQIFSRIDDKNSPAQKTLRPTMIRMCTEHPFHSLYQLFCLQPSNTSTNTTTERRSSGRISAGKATETDSTPTGRSLAAKAIFNHLLKNPATQARTAAVQELCEASLTFANHPVSKEKKVPSDQPIRNLRLSRGTVPVITAYTPIDPSTRYDSKECVCVEKYAGEYDTAGGINLPKIILCYGTDGRKYKQLFKGNQKDDLRQDAVMEQVFDLVNVVLNRDAETKRRNLQIRGYKVIPLASQAGILEFVGNTTTLKSWLDKAHPRYRPKDLKGIAKLLLDQQKSSGATPEANHKFYLQCMEKYKPVMRHYFTEIHKTPISWFRTRLNYTRSVATTSIVGHILGLGDRHTSNILMDNSTGEAIHIDLGVAFDQGKLLPVPENVPFRMTPDMIDGMGISGTNGVFQRCAEETLRVLRDGSDVIMTVLQVFRYDPLYNWTVSDYKMKKQVDHEDSATTTALIMKNPENERILTERLGIGINLDSTRAQEDADRALMGVSGKLSKTLSVAAAVRTLVAEATDTYNLGTMYYGWGPYY